MYSVHNMNLTSEINGTRTADIFNGLMLKLQRKERGNLINVSERGLCYLNIPLCFLVYFGRFVQE